MKPNEVSAHDMPPVAPAPNGRSERGTSPAEPPTIAPRRHWYRRPLIVIPAGVAALALLVIGMRYVVHAWRHESTDDAFVDAHVVAVSPRVASYVARVHIDDNVHVNKGDLLIELDPRDFEARLAQARANLAAAQAQHRGASINVRVIDTTSTAGVQQAEAGVQTAQRQVEAGRSRFEQSRAQVAAAEAEATRAATDVERYERLLRYGAVSRQEADNAVATNRTAIANLDAQRKAEQAAADTLRQQEAQLREAQARLASALAAPDQIAYSRAQAAQAEAQIAQLRSASVCSRSCPINSGWWPTSRRRSCATCVRGSRRPCGWTPIPAGFSVGTSTASRPGAARPSACCRQRTPPATT